MSDPEEGTDQGGGPGCGLSITKGAIGSAWSPDPAGRKLPEASARWWK
jgi:hypothetical protein